MALVPPDSFDCLQPKKHKAHMEVFSAFTGQPRGNDGLAMAKRVFHPPEAERWPTKEGNAFMAKNLTLIPEQKMELESDLNQEAFLKDFEKNPSYKQAFDFKTKMFTSMKTQRTSLVLLFRLMDQVT